VTRAGDCGSDPARCEAKLYMSQKIKAIATSRKVDLFDRRGMAQRDRVFR
jgi:hypothetical protein